MATARFSEAEQKIRRAVTYQEYGELESGIIAYCDAVRSHLSTLPAPDSRHRATLTHALDFLEWARLMLCAGQSMCSGRLQRAIFAGRFLAPPPPQSPGTLIDV
jgi:hypothetical protein